MEWMKPTQTAEHDVLYSAYSLNATLLQKHPLEDTPRNNVLPVTWASLSLVKSAH